jgi:hypothetical protein
MNDIMAIFYIEMVVCGCVHVMVVVVMNSSVVRLFYDLSGRLNVVLITHNHVRRLSLVVMDDRFIMNWLMDHMCFDSRNYMSLGMFLIVFDVSFSIVNLDVRIFVSNNSNVINCNVCSVFFFNVIVMVVTEFCILNSNNLFVIDRVYIDMRCDHLSVFVRVYMNCI